MPARLYQLRSNSTISPAAGSSLDVALEVPLGRLALGGLGERDVPRDARVHVLGDPLDRAALAGRVATLEDHHHAGAGVGHPLLHLHELLLEPEQLLLVQLLRELRARLSSPWRCYSRRAAGGPSTAGGVSDHRHRPARTCRPTSLACEDGLHQAAFFASHPGRPRSWSWWRRARTARVGAIVYWHLAAAAVRRERDVPHRRTGARRPTCGCAASTTR